MLVEHRVTLTPVFESKEERVFTDGKGSLISVKQARNGASMYGFWDRVSTGRRDEPVEVVFPMEIPERTGEEAQCQKSRK